MIKILSDKNRLTYIGILFENKEWVTSSIDFESQVDLGKHLEGVKRDLLMANLDYMVRVAEDVSMDMTTLEKESVKKLRGAVVSYTKDNKHSLKQMCQNMKKAEGFINTLKDGCDNPDVDLYALSIIKFYNDEAS